MEKYYEVAFYGEIYNDQDLGKIKKLMAPIVGKNETDIESLFSGERISLKKCPSYEHAKKYADLFESVGAKVYIEKIGAGRNVESDHKHQAQIQKKLLEFTKNSLSNPRALLVGAVLMVMGGGIGFWVASQYFEYKNLSVITPITPQHPADQGENRSASSSSDLSREAQHQDAQLIPVEGIKEAIANIEDQIREAEAEDGKYSGGLIKALIGSRLAILKQTHAMLQQRAQASLFRIGIKYTVDGKTFTPPDDAAVQLGVVERELTEFGTKIATAEAEAARYSGGLIQAVSLSTVAQLKQTVAMLEQKRLALKFSLPQYIGFKNESEFALPTASPPSANDSKDTAQQGKQWRIIEVDSKVTETNDTWWRYAWRLTLANDSQKPMIFSATIEFQDSDGFVIDQDRENSLVVPPANEKTFTGYALVKVPGAMKVQKTLAKVSAR